MKRIIAILSAIIVVLFCLCACGKVNGSETTTDTGHVHTYGEWQTIKEADCVNVGERERTCSCGETETEEISALGHTGGTADCKTLAKCERCGEEYGDYGPHTGGEAKTCKERAKCERCGVTYGDYGPHTGGTATCKQRARCEVCMHPYGEVDPENHRVVAATCVSKEKCRDCKKELGDSLDPSNHEKLEGKGLEKVCAGCKQTLLPETDTGIADSQNNKPIKYDEFFQKVTDERVARLSKAYSGVVPRYIRNDESKLLTPEETNKYVSPGSSNVKPNATIITREQALEDVKICFKGYYTYYGPYEYFGADKFENAEKKAINAVNEFFDSGKKQISDTELYDIIISSLDFVIDSHARVTCSSKGGSLTKLNQKEYYSYYVKDIVFRKDDVGYYTLANGNKWYLKDVNGGDFSEYLKVTIDESGELVYVLVRIANPSAEKLEGDTLTIQRGNVTYVYNILWSKYDVRRSTGETTTGVRVENSVPIIHARSFGRDALELQRYSTLGSQLRNQKLFMVDLRGNVGGYVRCMESFVKNYLGKNLSRAQIFGYAAVYDDKTVLSRSLSGYQLQNDRNKKLVLIDKGSASAAEWAYGDFETFSNTLFVGTNTSGCFLSASGSYLQLPNSTIVIRISTLYLDFYNDHYKGQHPEGIGLMPDVFVNSTEALDLSMKMIEYYGIEKSKDTSGITTFGTGKR